MLKNTERNKDHPSYQGISAALSHLRRLNQDIFNCFLLPEYASHLYLFERRLHLQKKHVMQAIAKLDGPADRQARVYLDQLYDGMLDYAQLRRRVTDATVFEICKKELIDIQNDIDQLLFGMIRKNDLDTMSFINHIQRLEDQYHQVLHVVAHEPLVFLLFIFSLKLFSEKINEFSCLS